LTRRPRRIGQLGKVPPPVGDQYGPFWTVEFFASGGTFKDSQQALIDSKRSDEAIAIPSNYKPSSTAEAVALNPTATAADRARQGILNDFDLQAYKQDFSVSFEGPVGSMQLTLTPPYDDALRIIENPVFTFSTVVVAEWGYIGPDGKVQSSGKYLFVAYKPSISFSHQDVTLTFEGEDILTSAASRSINTKGWDRNKNSAEDILKILAKKLGVELVVRVRKKLPPASLREATFGTRGRTKDVGEDHPLFQKGKEEPIVTKQNTTDWKFFLRLLRENNCKHVQGPENTVIIYDRDEYFQRGVCVDYNLMAYKQPTRANDVVLLSFAPNVDERQFAPAESQSIEAKQFNLASGAVLTKKYNAVDDPKAANEDGSIGAGKKEQSRKVETSGGPAVAQNKTGRGASYSVTSRSSKAPEMVRQQMLKQASLAGISATATMLGVTGLTPFTLVSVEGFGKRLSGVYRVLKVTHSLGSGGYDTEVDLLRTALTKLDTPDTKKPVSKLNETKKLKNRNKGCPVEPVRIREG